MNVKEEAINHQEGDHPLDIAIMYRPNDKDVLDPHPIIVVIDHPLVLADHDGDIILIE